MLVWRLVCESLGNREIADRLGFTESSVENTLNSLYQKLDLSTYSHGGKRVRLTQLYPLDDLPRHIVKGWEQCQ